MCQHQITKKEEKANEKVGKSAITNLRRKDNHASSRKLVLNMQKKPAIGRIGWGIAPRVENVLVGRYFFKSNMCTNTHDVSPTILATGLANMR